MSSLYRMFQRRGLQSQWEETNPILAIGEFGFAYDQNIVKVGDGETRWSYLPPVNGDPSVLVDYLQGEINSKLALAGGTMTGKITLDGDPTQALHAATKEYVDNTASGIVAKPQVLGATTANIDATYQNGTAGVGATLTHNTNGVFPSGAGGASGWAVGKGILVKNQTNKKENGRYFVSDMGSVSTPYVLTRCGYCDEADEIPGAYIFVQDGTNAGTGWIQVVEDPTTFVVGTDDIDVFQFSGAGSIVAGTNISVSGNQVSVVDGPTFSEVVTTNKGIANAQAKNALIASGFNSASGNFAHTSRVIMTAVAPSSAAPTTRPDGSNLAIGDIWISY
jgi:Major tropism determinant N-terminal domain